MLYLVTAFCSQPGCKVGFFTEQRHRLSYPTGPAGFSRPIKYLRCPNCRRPALIAASHAGRQAEGPRLKAEAEAGAPC